MTAEWKKNGENPTYAEARDANMEAMKKAKPDLADNKKAMACIKQSARPAFSR